MSLLIAQLPIGNFYECVMNVLFIIRKETCNSKHPQFTLYNWDKLSRIVSNDFLVQQNRIRFESTDISVNLWFGFNDLVANSWSHSIRIVLPFKFLNTKGTTWFENPRIVGFIQVTTRRTLPIDETLRNFALLSSAHLKFKKPRRFIHRTSGFSVSLLSKLKKNKKDRVARNSSFSRNSGL